MRSHHSPCPRPSTWNDGRASLRRYLLLGSGLAPALLPQVSPAENQFWNPGGVGGTGIWGTGIGDKNWNTTPGALTGNTAWPDTADDVAIFQDFIGGTIILFEPVQANGLIQNGSDYTINASTITLVPNSSSQLPFVEVTGGNLQVDSAFAGTDGLIKSGSGALTLSNLNPLTGTLRIEGGLLDLAGSVGTTTVEIAPGAVLRDRTGGLDAATDLRNDGRLELDAGETVAVYTSNGGSLVSGSGASLATDFAVLNDGSTVSAGLVGNRITTTGGVLLEGVTDTGLLQVAGGTLTNRGTLGDAATRIDIAAGAELVAEGVQNYDILSTSGPGVATWRGDLANPATLAPGGPGATGTLAVAGDLTNSPGGTLAFDVSATGNDLILVTGGAGFNGILEVNQLGTAAPAPFVPIQLVDAAAYSGNFSRLVENLPGAAFFNPANGNLILLGPSSGPRSLLGQLTDNQASSWIALYDDVIDPGVKNIRNRYGAPPVITSGIADLSRPELTQALEASFTPGGIDRQLLNRLSPAPYASLGSYAVTATRSRQRQVLNAPSLPVRQASGGKSGIKNSTVAGPDVFAGLPGEFFASADFLEVGTGSSFDEADYRLRSTGLLAGARVRINELVRAAAWFAVDTGDISGSLIEADASGWSFGVLGEYLLDESTDTRLVAGMSYGSYSFDGSRTGIETGGTGWRPALASFGDVEADSLELFAGVHGTLYRSDRVRVIPAATLRYATGSMDGFQEGVGSGSPIGLIVNGDRYRSALAELSVRVEADLTTRLALQGIVGLNARLGEDDRVLEARLSRGARTIRGVGEELSSNSVFLGVGANYLISDDLVAGISYLAEFRSEADTQHGVSLSSTFRF